MIDAFIWKNEQKNSKPILIYCFKNSSIQLNQLLCFIVFASLLFMMPQ